MVDWMQPSTENARKLVKYAWLFQPTHYTKCELFKRGQSIEYIRMLDTFFVRTFFFLHTVLSQGQWWSIFLYIELLYRKIKTKRFNLWYTNATRYIHNTSSTFSAMMRSWCFISFANTAKLQHFFCSFVL